MNLAFDIGATNLRVAIMEADGVGRIVHTHTPADPSEAIETLATLVEELGSPESVRGGVAAVVENGMIISSTNLPAWTGFHFAELLSARLHASVEIINDAELAALGEALYGAGKGMRTVGYIGIGTGVGTALVRDGMIVEHSSDGTARDTIIALSTGGTLEERIGGHALSATFGKPPAELTTEIWDELTPLLVEGIQNAIRLWSPDLVVLGGSLLNDMNGFRVAEVVRELADASVPVLPAVFGDSSGLNGARALL